ncbi:BQ5605_C012g06701 [Microbotryum silenes-dioicae]|uniref:BQ5605_C012g06701 protein n=1 Tax=Microbotryum silenes-dioicae TaxID=796604 RepID=A0A2X0NW25_9BASI|nr:BQ5605_C012g06701 [Microbotryum silenes-dioicae]
MKFGIHKTEYSFKGVVWSIRGNTKEARSASVRNISKSKERSKRRGQLGPAQIGD